DEMITSKTMEPSLNGVDPIRTDKMLLRYYTAADRVPYQELPVDERFKDMHAEIVSTYAQEEAVTEAKRCMSCGQCFDCGTCWSYCQDNAIVKPLVKGEPYSAKFEFCTGCKKCAEQCPCGFIEMH
ncbi:MAG: hypothetical protein JSW50_04210, partial [Candidatus Latescibacterota bacterium]